MYTVLIADDEAIVRMMLSSMIDWDEMELKLAGCVSNGREALAYLEQHPVDILITDIQMPVMNGYEATRAIRTMDRDGAKAVPILAMTADAFSEDIQAAKDAGMNGHMAKPLDKAILWREIGKYLNSDFSPETAGKSGVNH